MIVMLMGLEFVASFVANLFKSRGRLEAENALLRRRLNKALRQVPTRLRLTQRIAPLPSLSTVRKCRVSTPE